MRMISVDDESIELMENAAAALEAALAARARRVDPDGILSRSFEMSRIKTTEVVRQLRRPKPLEWPEYSVAQKALFLELCRVMIDEKDEHTKALVFRKIRGNCFRYREEPEAFASGEAPAQGSIRDITMAADAATAKVGTSAMRKRMREGGDGTAPQDPPRKRR